MTKNEIHNAIDMLQNGDELVSFVESRIQELEDNSIETTVGQNYTTTFREYISQKTHYKPGERLKDAECPDLVYDDLTPYISLIKSIKRNGGYDSFSLFTSIFFDICSYLPSDDNGMERSFTYLSNKDKRVSIKQISEEACASCSEKAGMAHNLFKFMGIDSEVVCGYRDSEKHAYNILYPKGYDNEPMILYDPSFFVNFSSENIRQSFAYYEILKKEDYERLLAGEPIKADLLDTEIQYRNYYNLGSEFSFDGDTPVYSAGLERREYKYTPHVNIDSDGKRTVDIKELKKNSSIDLSEVSKLVSEEFDGSPEELRDLSFAVLKQYYESWARDRINVSKRTDAILESILNGHILDECEAFEMICDDPKAVEEFTHLTKLKNRVDDNKGITLEDFNECCDLIGFDDNYRQIIENAFASRGLLLDGYTNNDSHKKGDM